jgi:hypothetical protein
MKYSHLIRARQTAAAGACLAVSSPAANAAVSVFVNAVTDGGDFDAFVNFNPASGESSVGSDSPLAAYGTIGSTGSFGFFMGGEGSGPSYIYKENWEVVGTSAPEVFEQASFTVITTEGFAIDSGSAWGTPAPSYFDVKPETALTDGGTFFIGYRFREDSVDDWFYGWAEFTYNQGSFGDVGPLVLHRWAFNSEAGEGLVTPAPIPEAGTAAFLLTVGALVLLVRKRLSRTMA